MRRRLWVLPAAAFLAGLAHAVVTVPPAAPACQTQSAETISADQVSKLLEAGWYGIAGDGAERLYSPSCVTR